MSHPLIVRHALGCIVTFVVIAALVAAPAAAQNLTGKRTLFLTQKAGTQIMERTWAVLLLFSVTAWGQDPITVIRGGTVIDSTGQAPIEDAVIVIEGERIREIGTADRVTVPEGAEVIDATGKWIIPGLIDAHVHFFQSGGIYTRPDVIDLRKWRSYDDEREWIRERLPNTFARYLSCGITGVVDVGGPMWNFDVRELANQTARAPRVAVAGPLASTYVPDALQVEDPPIVRVFTPQEARELIREQLGEDPDLTKVWFIHRPGDDLSEQVEIVEAAIEESHAGGVRAAVHATQLEVAKAAIRAGADVLVHSVSDLPVDDEFIELLKENDVLYTSTLIVGEGYREVLNQEVDLLDVESELGDPEVIATWSVLEGIPHEEIPGGLRRRQAPEGRPVAFDNLKRLQEAGVRVVGATDAGNIGTLHGPSLFREFDLMREAGLAPMEILISATRNAAAVMGRQDDVGTLEAGKYADLVILDADPLEDILNTTKIYLVMKGGRVFD